MNRKYPTNREFVKTLRHNAYYYELVFENVVFEFESIKNLINYYHLI